MKRQLTVREWFLLALLGAVALVSGYVMLIYMPLTSRRDKALEETELVYMQVDAAGARLTQKRQMERELSEIFAQNERPLSLAPYDNIQSVILELNSILAAASEYSLSFGSVDSSEAIVRRNISLSFTGDSYGTVKAILEGLRNSAYRCMLDDLNITLYDRQDGTVSVSGTIVFFEYIP